MCSDNVMQYLSNFNMKKIKPKKMAEPGSDRVLQLRNLASKIDHFFELARAIIIEKLVIGCHIEPSDYASEIFEENMNKRIVNFCILFYL